VDILWHILVAFILRLTFGMSLAMGLTSPRLVTSGYFRVHLWVLLGLNTLASLALFSRREAYAAATPYISAALGVTIGLAIVSYAGAIVWLYERKQAGRFVLLIIAAAALMGAWLLDPWFGSRSASAGLASRWLLAVVPISSGWLLGSTMAAMLLGHWYLNTPTMQLGPLKRLVLGMALAVALRAVIAGLGLGMNLMEASHLGPSFLIFISFRWLAGLLGSAVMCWMAWQTLKVPNTQSATGILYAGVVLTFLGELVAQLLSQDLPFPV
jgi:hypothetical protein